MAKRKATKVDRMKRIAQGMGGSRWWKNEKGSDVHSAVFDAWRAIRTKDARKALLTHCLRMYGGIPYAGYSADDFLERPPMWDDADSDRWSSNVIRRVVGALHAELCSSEVRPMFLTDGGNYALQLQAKKMGKWCRGLFDACGFDAEMRMMALFALVCGSGAIKAVDPTTAGGRIRFEAIFPGDLFVDERAAIDGKPRALYQIMHIDRDVLADCFPDNADDIDTAPSDTGDGASWSLGDQVCVLEAWRLPSRAPNGLTGDKGSQDGRHVICIEGATLLDEVWEQETFPVKFFHLEPAIRGFWAQGIAELLTGCQQALNRLEETIQNGQELASLRFFVERSSNVEIGHLEAMDGAVVEYSGTPPQIAAVQTVHPEIYAERQTRTSQGFEEIGVSQLAAHGQKPQGVDAAVAIREVRDIGSARFVRLQKDFETVGIECSKEAVRLGRRLSKEDPSYEVVFRSKGKIERLKFGDFALDDDQFVVDTFPVALLPSTPAGKLSKLSELQQSGLLDRLNMSAEQLYKLLDYPDLGGADLSAAEDAAEADVASIIDDGIAYAPEPFMNLELTMAVAVRRYLTARREKVDEDRLEMLRTYIAGVESLMAKARPPAPPPAPPMPMAPPGAPMPVPSPPLPAAA